MDLMDTAKVVPFIIFGLGLLLIYRGITRYLLMQKIKNIPTSNVRSAAVGLVELSGKAKSKEEMISPISKEKCVFYELTAQYYYSGERSGG